MANWNYQSHRHSSLDGWVYGSLAHEPGAAPAPSNEEWTYKSHRHSTLNGWVYESLLHNPTQGGAAISGISGAIAPGEQLTATVSGLSTITSVVFGGESISIDSTPANQVVFTLPADIPLPWGVNQTLFVSDGTDSASRIGNRLNAPTGWSYVNFDGNVPAYTGPNETESFHELANNDLSIIGVAGDQYQYEAVSGLTVELDTTFTKDPAEQFAAYYAVLQSGVRSQEVPYAVAATQEGLQPDAFSFTSVSNAVGLTEYTSSVTLTGLAGPSIVNGSGSPSVEYSINGGARISIDVPAIVNAGDVIEVFVTASNVAGNSNSATLDIGGITGTYSVTTSAAVVVELPTITLLGDNPLQLVEGDTFVDPGVEAFDHVVGDISSNVVVTGSVNTSLPGSYTLTYTVAHTTSGQEAFVQRTVIVVAAVSFVGTIPAVSLTEGDSISIDVSAYFSGVLSYYIDVSPEEQLLSITQAGGISGSAVAGIHRVVVVGDNGTQTARSNVFRLVVQETPVSLISGEPIEADIIIEPAHSDGLRNTAYDDNTNAVLVSSVRGQISRQPIGSPTITGSIRRSDDTLIQTLTFQQFTDGWLALISDDDLSDAVVHLDIVAGGANSDWEFPLAWTKRIL